MTWWAWHWASLLSPSSSSLRNNRSMSAWASRGTSYIIRAAFVWMTSSFFRCICTAEEKIEEQYSICDLIRAVYNNFNSSLGRYEVALVNIPRSPRHLITTLSICGPKVRCWSKVTPSSFTVFSGLMMQLSSVRWKSSGMGLREWVCLKIEIHKIYEIQLPKYRNPPTKYEIHCLKVEIHKVHEIHSNATSAKYRNPRNPQIVRHSHWQSTNQQA